MPFSMLVVVGLQASLGQVSLSPPDFDRWMYPYNLTPGFRGAAPTFSGYGSGSIDDRYGQALYGWITGESVEVGWPPSSYAIESCVVYVAVLTDGIIYDPTLDPPDTHEVDGPPDPDPGRPAIISGAGFRNDFTGWTFGETGSFGPGGVGTRNCYAADFDDEGQFRDISNSLTDEFVPNQFGIGQTDLVSPGDVIPQYSEVAFEINVADPDIQCYLRRSLSDGLIDFVLSSYHQGSQDGSGSYPNWIMKENTLVDFGVVPAARLEIDVELIEPSGVQGDVDGDGIIGIDDLLLLLGDFGRCPCCPTDIDLNGSVEVDDLLFLIGSWGE